MNFNMRSLPKWLLIGLGVGALVLGTPQLARSQSSRVNREAVRALNLSRSQMREMRSVMQSYQSDIQNILTSEQIEQLEDLQEQARDQGDAPVDLAAELNLTTDQATQLEALQTDMASEFQEILSAEQLRQAQDMGLPGL